MRSTDNLNFVPKHIMTSLLESPCLIIGPIILSNRDHYKGLTDKGQFQYLTGLKGSQEGTYLYTTFT